ncbi:MAG: hypothetical protein ACYC0Q_12265 [Eubacteriales bacterium]
MRVIGTEVRIIDLPFVDQVYLTRDVEEVLALSDFVVLSCPETPETLNKALSQGIYRHPFS